MVHLYNPFIIVAMALSFFASSAAYANNSEKEEEQAYLATLTKESCKEFEIMRQTVRGTYTGYEEGDFGWCTIKQDNGKSIIFNCDEEEAIKAFGKQGNYVEAVIRREQFWNPDPAFDSCWRATIMVSGKKVKALPERVPNADDQIPEEEKYLNTLNKKKCKNLELLRKTVKGKYLGYEVADSVWCTILQDNGEKFFFACDELEADKTFGKEGNYVEALIKREQFWDDSPSYDCCRRMEIMVSGKQIVEKKNENLQTAVVDEITGAYVKSRRTPHDYLDIMETFGEDTHSIACPYEKIEKFGFDIGDWVTVQYQKRPAPAGSDLKGEIVDTCVGGKVITKFYYGTYEADTDKYLGRLVLSEDSYPLMKFKVSITRKNDQKSASTSGTARISDGLLVFFQGGEEKAEGPSFTMRFRQNAFSIEKRGEHKFLESEFAERDFRYVPMHSPNTKGLPDIRKDEIPGLAKFLGEVYGAAAEGAEMPEGIDMTNPPSPDKLAMLGYYHARIHQGKSTFVSDGKPVVISGTRQTSYEIIAIQDIVNAAKKLLDYDLDPNVFTRMGEHGIAVAGKNILRGPGDPGIFFGCTVTNVKRNDNGLLQVSLEDAVTEDDGKKKTYSAVVKDRIVNGRREYTVIKMIVDKNGDNNSKRESGEQKLMQEYKDVLNDIN